MAKFDRFETIRKKCQQKLASANKVQPTLLWFHANGRKMLGPTMLHVIGR